MKVILLSGSALKVRVMSEGGEDTIYKCKNDMPYEVFYLTWNSYIMPLYIFPELYQECGY